MPRPEECRFTPEHEWIYPEGDSAVMGISDFAQQELGDIVYLNLGETGRNVKVGDELGEIESVKAVAEFYAPASGEVTAVNTELAEHPERVNQDPFGSGWLVRIKLADSSSLSQLMDFAAYKKYLEESAH